MTAIEVLEAASHPSSTVEATQIKQVLEAHDEVLRAGQDLIAAAARAGNVLLEIKACHDRPGTWRAWLTEHMPFTYATAHLYMRCAKHEALIREQGWTRIREVKEGLGALVEPEHQAKGANGRAKPEWMKQLAREMYEDGTPITHIAGELGVHFMSVKGWVDPEFQARSRQKVAAINKRRIRAERALREQEREQRIKDAVKKAGAAVAEAYAAAERMQDVLAQAQREATDTEAKRQLAEASMYQRRMRDRIVRALGVT